MGQSTITPLILRTQFENLVDDEYDVTHTYQLLTQAKNWVETVYKLKILEASDASQTANPGDTYLTLKSLPTDLRSILKLYVGTLEYLPTDFKRAIPMRNAARRYYVDWKRFIAGSTCLGLTGTVGSAQTITVDYLTKTDDLTEANENTAGIVLWPDEYQPLIPYQAAKILQGNIDADDTNFRMSVKQEEEYERLLSALVGWDADLKLAGMNYQGGYADQDATEVPIGLM